MSKGDQKRDYINVKDVDEFNKKFRFWNNKYLFW